MVFLILLRELDREPQDARSGRQGLAVGVRAAQEWGTRALQTWEWWAVPTLRSCASMGHPRSGEGVIIPQPLSLPRRDRVRVMFDPILPVTQINR